MEKDPAVEETCNYSSQNLIENHKKPTLNGVWWDCYKKMAAGGAKETLMKSLSRGQYRLNA